MNASNLSDLGPDGAISFAIMNMLVAERMTNHMLDTLDNLIWSEICLIEHRRENPERPLLDSTDHDERRKILDTISRHFEELHKAVMDLYDIESIDTRMQLAKTAATRFLKSANDGMETYVADKSAEKYKDVKKNIEDALGKLDKPRN